MHCSRVLVLFAAIVGAGCNADDSDTTVVTTAITTTNGNATIASATLTEGSGGPVSGSGSEVGDGMSSGGGSGEAGTTDPDDTGTGSDTDTEGGADSTGDTSSSDSSDTGSSGGTGEEGTTGGGVVCDPLLLLAMTPGCVQGSAIESAAWADAYCAQTFGAGWIWLEHHQQGGWYVQGTWIDDNGIGERGWVYVNDQTSACYETDYGVTWVRAAYPEWECRADCWSTIGLEGQEYNPQDGQKCNSYDGDTPCEYCRPLICARP